MSIPFMCGARAVEFDGSADLAFARCADLLIQEQRAAAHHDDYRQYSREIRIELFITSPL